MAEKNEKIKFWPSTNVPKIHKGLLKDVKECLTVGYFPYPEEIMEKLTKAYLLLFPEVYRQERNWMDNETAIIVENARAKTLRIIARELAVNECVVLVKFHSDLKERTVNPSKEYLFVVASIGADDVRCICLTILFPASQKEMKFSFLDHETGKRVNTMSYDMDFGWGDPREEYVGAGADSWCERSKVARMFSRVKKFDLGKILWR